MSDTEIQEEFLTEEDVAVLSRAREVLKGARTLIEWKDGQNAWRLGFVSAHAEAAEHAIFEFLNTATHYGHSVNAKAGLSTKEEVEASG